MMNRCPILCALLLLLVLAKPVVLPAAGLPMPQLEKRGEVTQLIVDGNPYIILGGEVHNSAGSTLDALREVVPHVAGLGANTILVPVSWQLIEPEEGKFDWSTLDAVVGLARTHHLRVVLLWFGSWKNGLSHYVPSWVKRDPARFPRARLATGTTEVLSLFGPATLQADGLAFVAMLTHLRELDEQERTVIMVQIENEVGLLGDSRDRRPEADAAFAQPVPAELLEHLQANREALKPGLRALWEKAGARTSGSWSEVFGSGPAADEVFMAWHYARFLHRLAQGGKAVYPLPLFVNAWIGQPQDRQPGDYPSGGPQAHLLDVWQAGAPAIDLFAPDIYLPDFGEVCAEFAHRGNPLFVPETRSGDAGMANAFLAFGRHDAIGFSPFGIESREPDPATSPVPPAYRVLRQLRPLITAHQAAGTIAAVIATPDAPQTIELGGYRLTATVRAPRRGQGEVPPRGYGIFFATGPDEFIVAGGDLSVRFTPATPGPAIAGLDRVEEGVFESGQWHVTRVLNGDEVMLDYTMAQLAADRQTGTGLKFRSATPTIQRVKLYRYE